MATSRSLLLLLFVTLLRMHHPCNGLELDAPVNDPPLIQRRLHGGGVHREFFCSLDHIEITQIAKNETVAKFYDVNGTTNNATTPTTSHQNTYAAKACACYSGFLNSTYYCPADSNYCSILI